VEVQIERLELYHLLYDAHKVVRHKERKEKEFVGLGLGGDIRPVRRVYPLVGLH
jgi:hypothetical protein